MYGTPFERALRFFKETVLRRKTFREYDTKPL